jgi:hypothetical protein
MAMSGDPSPLSDRARQLASARAPFWEYRLFVQVLTDEIEAARSLLLAPPVARRTVVSINDFGNWARARIQALETITSGLEGLMNANHDDAFGPSGQPGDVSSIVRFARQIARYYRQMIEWAHSVRNAEVDPRLRQATYELSFFADDALAAVARYGPDLGAQLEAAIQQPRGSRTQITARLILTVPENANARYASALDNAFRALTTPDIPSSPTGPGYIYILTNPSMGGYLKIGRTTRNPRDRAAELSGATAVPTPFELAFDAYVEDCFNAEAFVHARLTHDGYRVSANREFFNVDLTTAIKVITEAQRVVAGPRRAKPS